jgi:hypothetical protein
LKPEWWGLPLVQEEKYQERKCDKGRNYDDYCIIIIIILEQYQESIQ